MSTLEFMPATVDELLRKLDEDNPPFIPQTNDSRDSIMWRAGRRQLVEDLLQLDRETDEQAPHLYVVDPQR